VRNYGSLSSNIDVFSTRDHPRAEHKPKRLHEKRPEKIRESPKTKAKKDKIYVPREINPEE
jgi:hypothetical protein